MENPVLVALRNSSEPTTAADLAHNVDGDAMTGTEVYRELLALERAGEAARVHPSSARWVVAE
jgi:hypothetical protein